MALTANSFFSCNVTDGEYAACADTTVDVEKYSEL